MYKKILVPLEGSKNDEVVLGRARDLAQDFAAAVTLIMVYRLAYSYHPFELVREMEEGSLGWRAKRKAEKYLPEAEKSVAVDHIPVNTYFCVVEQPEDEAIVKYAEEHDFELIMFARPKRSLVRRWLLGNIEEKVMRRSTIPVLFVSAREPDRSAGLKKREQATSTPQAGDPWSARMYGHFRR